MQILIVLPIYFFLLRGDVFTVYNEMGDGWLWVKSLRTKESGIIFSALVEDMTKNADPNEGKGIFSLYFFCLMWTVGNVIVNKKLVLGGGTTA